MTFAIEVMRGQKTNGLRRSRFWRDGYVWTGQNSL